MRCWIRGGALNALNVSATHILTSSLAFGQHFDLVWVETRTGWMVTCCMKLHQFGTGGSSLDQQCNTSSLWSFLWRCSRVHCVLRRFRQSDDKSLSWEAIFKLFAIEKGMNWHKWSTIILVDFSNSSQMISMCFVKWERRGGGNSSLFIKRVDCLDGGGKRRSEKE